MEAKPGDKIKVLCEEKEHTGILIDTKKDTTVLKLENGYNIGISNNSIKSIELLEEGKDIEIKYTAKQGEEKGLPKISVLHTGGTIASKVDYRTGAVYSSFKPEDILGMFPEIGDIANIESRLVSNMWSDDLRFKHISVLAQAVKEEAEKNVKGIIIGMGTDNLAVAAAGLSFALEQCNIPVILVGAQRSSDRGSSDAAMNMICAAEFITKTEFKGVAICMHDQTSDERCAILPACKTKKLHSSRRDAFKAVNDSPIAIIDYKTKKIKYNKNIEKKEDKGLEIKPLFEEKVGILKIHVNMFPEQFLTYKGFKGLVIEGTGLGHTPGQTPDDWSKENKGIYPAIQEVIDSGCVVVMTTNCIFGRVQMDVYDKGRDLKKLGVISGQDMLSETAMMKLSWLLANNKAEVNDLIGKNLKGEINERISETEYLE